MSTTDSTALTPIMEGDARRDALMRALGWEKLADGQRDLALSIATRYDLDVMLRHLVLIDGKPYITRDGLLHVAHKSGDFDGIEVDPPTLDDDKRFYRTMATVWRKSFSRPFRYPGRYPATGGNARYNEEMCIKVAEVMTLRRAFDVAAPVIEEQWDGEIPEGAPETSQPSSLAERVAQRALAAGASQEQPVADASAPVESIATPVVEQPALSVVPSDDEDVDEALISEIVEPEQVIAETGPLTDDEAAALAEDEPDEPETPPVVSPLRQQPESLEPDQAPTDDADPLDHFKAWARDKDTELVRAIARELFPNLSGFKELNAKELGVIQHEYAKADAKRNEAASSERCAAPSPLSSNRCTLDPGHKGKHRHGTRETWD